MFNDFYTDFNMQRALDMLKDLDIDYKQKFKTLSKGTKEKVQLILVMAREAKLYVLDEPIAGVDPAARDYILRTILKNYNPEATVIISTHLIQDVEQIFVRLFLLITVKLLCMKRWTMCALNLINRWISYSGRYSNAKKVIQI